MYCNYKHTKYVSYRICRHVYDLYNSKGLFVISEPVQKLLEWTNTRAFNSATRVFSYK